MLRDGFRAVAFRGMTRSDFSDSVLEKNAEAAKAANKKLDGTNSPRTLH